MVDSGKSGGGGGILRGHSKQQAKERGPLEGLCQK